MNDLLIAHFNSLRSKEITKESIITQGLLADLKEAMLHNRFKILAETIFDTRTPDCIKMEIMRIVVPLPFSEERFDFLGQYNDLDNYDNYEDIPIFKDLLEYNNQCSWHTYMSEGEQHIEVSLDIKNLGSDNDYWMEYLKEKNPLFYNSFMELLKHSEDLHKTSLQTRSRIKDYLLSIDLTSPASAFKLHYDKATLYRQAPLPKDLWAQDRYIFTSPLDGLPEGVRVEYNGIWSRSVFNVHIDMNSYIPNEDRKPLYNMYDDPFENKSCYTVAKDISTGSIYESDLHGKELLPKQEFEWLYYSEDCDEDYNEESN
jgi:hypothetical protein